MDAPLDLVATRWFFYAAATILFGSSLFRIYAPDDARHLTGWPYKAAARALSLVALLASAAWLLALSHQLDAQSNLLATAQTVLTQTTFGPDFAARLIFAAVALVAAVFDKGRVVLVCAAVLLLLEGGDGHAAAHGWLGETVQAIYVLAAGAWIGGLFPLARCLIAAQRLEASAAVLPIVRRFSDVAAAAVFTILATGVANVVLLGPAFVLTSAYARTLGLKLALVASMIALAAYNRLRLAPRLDKAQGRAAARMLIKTVVAEEALALAVLAAVAWLGLLDPYMQPM